MAVELTATTEADIDKLIALFSKAFQLKGNEPLRNPALLRWKYFDPRPDWQGSRSYVLHSGQRWLAHACVCPMTIRHGGNTVNGVLLVDWLSTVPGAGAEIYRRFYPMVDVVFGNGGSTQARRTINELKYPTIGSVAMHSRPFKPLALYGGSKRSAADLLRLGRNFALSMAPGHTLSPGWRSTQVSQFTEEHRAICDHSPEGFLQTVRSPEHLNYYLRCPLAKMSGHAVYQGSALQGYFILAEFQTESKLVDLRINSVNPEHWAAGIALATRAASQLAAPMLLVSSTLPLMTQGLQANRFRHFEDDPLYLYDPADRLNASKLPLHITPFDGDQAYQ